MLQEDHDGLRCLTDARVPRQASRWRAARKAATGSQIIKLRSGSHLNKGNVGEFRGACALRSCPTAAGCGSAVDADLMGNIQYYQPYIRGYRAAAEILSRPRGPGLATSGLIHRTLNP
jgi:hypothetical protein